jgi:hypothetical protein
VAPPAEARFVDHLVWLGSVAERLDGLFLDDSVPNGLPGDLGAVLQDLHGELASALDRLGARERAICRTIGRRCTRIERILAQWRRGRPKRDRPRQ